MPAPSSDLRDAIARRRREMAAAAAATAGTDAPGDEVPAPDGGTAAVVEDTELELVECAVPTGLNPQNLVVIGFSPRTLQHEHTTNARYPERPSRVARSMEQIRDSGWLREATPPSGGAAIIRRMPLSTAVLDGFSWADLAPLYGPTTVPLFPAESQEAAAAAVTELRLFVESGVAPASLPTDTFVGPGSADAARAAAAMMVEAAVGVCRGRWRHAFALTRPPGHHCSHSPRGFCLLNNVAIAAAAVLTRGLAHRIAIIDCDVHHGEGTQSLCDALNANFPHASVLYASTHRYDKGSFFPNAPTEGACDVVGPYGLNVNVAFDTSRTKAPDFLCICDATLRIATDDLLIPLLQDAFRPELVLLSCGFDALEGDPLGGMGVRNGLSYMAARLAGLGCGVCAALEGGYDVAAVAQGVSDVVAAVSGRAPQYTDRSAAAGSWCEPPSRIWRAGQRAQAAAGEPASSDEMLLAANEAWTRSTVERTLRAHADFHATPPKAEVSKERAAVQGALKAFFESRSPFTSA
jgi:acetoin utilization deacetylase AcuC-like enzyme